MEVIAWSESKAKMKLYSLPCLLEEDKCSFSTIKLEFPKAKEILELHMKYVHERLELRNNCDYSEKDTDKSGSKEITEDEMKAICEGCLSLVLIDFKSTCGKS